MTWLSEKLTSALAERGVAADALARQMGIERSRMNNILAGKATPNESLVKRLAAYFDEDPASWVAETSAEPGAKVKIEVPSDYIKVAKASEIDDGDMKIVFHELVTIANVDGQFYAFGNVCPHAAGPIGDGFLTGCIVECPWHAGRWDIRTGKALTLIATADVPSFPVRLVDDDIEVLLSDAVLKQGVVSSTPA